MGCEGRWRSIYRALAALTGGPGRRGARAGALRARVAIPARPPLPAAACACWRSSGCSSSNAQALPLGARLVRRDGGNSDNGRVELERSSAFPVLQRPSSRGIEISKRAGTTGKNGKGRVAADGPAAQDSREQREAAGCRAAKAATKTKRSAAGEPSRSAAAQPQPSTPRRRALRREPRPRRPRRGRRQGQRLRRGARRPARPARRTSASCSPTCSRSSPSTPTTRSSRSTWTRSGRRSPSPASGTPTSAASRARSSSRIPSAWRRSAPACASTPRRSARRCCTTRSRTRAPRSTTCRSASARTSRSSWTA